MSVQAKLQEIKARAQASLTTQDDHYDDVATYLDQAEAIREKSKLHNEDKAVKLEAEFKAEIKEINKKAKKSDNITTKEKIGMLTDAYYRFAKKMASLDRLGSATLFYDSLTDMYIRVTWVTYTTVDGEKEERLLTHRFKPAVIKKFIDLDTKQRIGVHIDPKMVNNIMRDFRPYIKEYEPLKPKFYGDFFNTYTPNGFLDITVPNTITVEKFTAVTMPMRYPHINALLENIAPFEDERVFMLNWLSTILNTAKKTRTAIILKGIQRTGKGVFVSKIIEYAMNEANCFTATNANLSDNFNNYLEDKLFIKFDEVKGDFHKDRDIANKIKLIVSEENISIRSMHTNPYMIRFYANCIFLSNEELPLPMDQSDERLSVIETRSTTLADVAKQKFDIDIHEFIDQIEKERDEFVIHLKMTRYDKRLASSTIKNKTKKAIQDATATTQAILKTAFRARDIETLEEMISEAIADSPNEQLIKMEEEVYKEGVDGSYKSKRIVSFPYTNTIMMEHFLDEIKSGHLSNTSLKWFSIALKIDHATKSDRKFGDFWNIILTKPMRVKLRYPSAIKEERFRTIDQHADINTFMYDGQKFAYTGAKTAEPIQDPEEIF